MEPRYFRANNKNYYRQLTYKTYRLYNSQHCPPTSRATLEQHTAISDMGKPSGFVKVSIMRSTLFIIATLLIAVGREILQNMHSFMMTSSNGNIFRVTGPLCGEFTRHRRFPLTKASDAELWYCLWSAPEQTVGQTIETPVLWDAIVLIMASL